MQLQQGLPKEQIERQRLDYILANNQEKDEDFRDKFIEQIEAWKLQPEQKSITTGAEKQHMDDCKLKIERLCKDFEFLLDSKLHEGIMIDAHKNGLWSLVLMARALSNDPNVRDNEEAIDQKFEECWHQAIEALSAQARIKELRWTYCENLKKVFKTANKFMPEINNKQFASILECCDSEAYDNSLPAALMDYLIRQLSGELFSADDKQLDC